MAHCDLCGTECKASQMVELLPSYKVPGVSDICPTCEKWANKIKGELQDAALADMTVKLRAAISARAGAGKVVYLRPEQPTRRPWWRVWA